MDCEHFFSKVGKVRLFKESLNLTNPNAISHLKFKLHTLVNIIAVQSLPHLSFIGFSHLSGFHLDATMVGVIIRFYQLGYYVNIGQSVFSCEVLVHLVLKCTVETLHHGRFEPRVDGKKVNVLDAFEACLVYDQKIESSEKL